MEQSEQLKTDFVKKKKKKRPDFLWLYIFYFQLFFSAVITNHSVSDD